MNEWKGICHKLGISCGPASPPTWGHLEENGTFSCRLPASNTQTHHQAFAGSRCPMCTRGITELLDANPSGEAALLPGFLTWENSQSAGSQQGEVSLSLGGSRKVSVIPKHQGPQRCPSFSKPEVQFPSADLSPQGKGDVHTEDSFP